MKHGLIVFLVSMVPLIELRGAIPYGVAYGMPLWLTYLIAIVGEYAAGAVYLSLRPERSFFGARISLSSEGSSPSVWKKGERGGQKLQAKAGQGLFWALLLFVGIPLPGTGAWTGTLRPPGGGWGFEGGGGGRGGGGAGGGGIRGLLSVLGVSAFGAVVQ